MIVWALKNGHILKADKILNEIEPFMAKFFHKKLVNLRYKCVYSSREHPVDIMFSQIVTWMLDTKCMYYHVNCDPDPDPIRFTARSKRKQSARC